MSGWAAGGSFKNKIRGHNSSTSPPRIWSMQRHQASIIPASSCSRETCEKCFQAFAECKRAPKRPNRARSRCAQGGIVRAMRVRHFVQVCEKNGIRELNESNLIRNQKKQMVSKWPVNRCKPRPPCERMSGIFLLVSDKWWPPPNHAPLPPLWVRGEWKPRWAS